MSQNPDVLAPLKGTPRASRFATLDIETWGLDARPRGFALGTVWDGRTAWAFTSRDDMRDFLLSPRWRSWTFYAHNGGRYDYLSLFGNYWTAFGPDRVNVRGSKMYELSHVSGKQITRFRDSFNLMPTSLEEIGNRLGFPKGKTPEKFIRGEPVPLETSDFDYCLQDCKVLYEALRQLQTTLGELRPTLPATAMAVFRRNYLPEPVWVRRDLDREFRPSYYGGRVEVYRLGNLPQPNFYLDVRSLFPYAMVSTAFPNPARLAPLHEPSINDLLMALHDKEGYASVSVEVPKMRIGPLPYRRNDGRLLFPAGRLTGSWTFPELRLAMSEGCNVTRVSRIVASRPIDSPFTEYVKRFYAMKQTAEGFLRDIAKLLLNGLYGKFGEFHDSRDIYAERFDEKVLSAMRKEFGEGVGFYPISASRADGYYVIPQTERWYAGHSVYCWAAYITARARVVNYLHQKRLNELGYEVYYTDTDSFSLAYGEPAYVVGGSNRPLPDGNELGDLSIVRCEAGHPTALKWVGGNKYYETCCSQKLKGVKKNSDILSSDSEGRPVLYRYREVRGLRDAIRKGEEPGTPYFVGKQVGSEYEKRAVHKDGTTEIMMVYDT